MGNNYSNKIIFNKTITPIGNGEQLLFNNQIKFNEFHNEIYKKNNFPSLKEKFTKKGKNNKRIEKTDSFKNLF